MGDALCTYCHERTADVPSDACPFPTVHAIGRGAASERAAKAHRERTRHEDWRYWMNLDRP